MENMTEMIMSILNDDSEPDAQVLADLAEAKRRTDAMMALKAPARAHVHLYGSYCRCSN